MARKRTLFKINGKVVVEETRDLFLNEIDELIWVIASECECTIHDIEVETEIINYHAELSEYDVTSAGIINWKDTQFKIVSGVTLKGDMDDLLDSIGKKYRDNYLELS